MPSGVRSRPRRAACRSIPDISLAVGSTQTRLNSAVTIVDLTRFPATHVDAVNEALGELIEDPDVRALAVVGSLARGDALPGSDVDLLVVVTDEALLDVPRIIRSGCVVEQHRYTLAAARDRFDRRPAHVYLLLDSVPLYDPEGLFGELVEAAKARQKTYQMPTRDIDLKRYWWRKVRSKLKNALERDDTLLAGFLASTCSAEIVSDLFALEGRPPPPVGGTAFARLAELQTSEDVSALFDGDSIERAQAALRLLDPILRELPD